MLSLKVRPDIYLPFQFSNDVIPQDIFSFQIVKIIGFTFTYSQNDFAYTYPHIINFGFQYKCKLIIKIA